MELADFLALSTPNACGAIGTLFIQECNISLATFCIDLGSDIPACNDVFDLSDQFHLEVLPLDDNWYLCRIHSHRKHTVVTFPHGEQNIVEICKIPIIHHQLGIDPVTHKLFQRALSAYSYWLLIIRTRSNTILLIEHPMGNVRSIIEKPLDAVEFTMIQ